MAVTGGTSPVEDRPGSEEDVQGDSSSENLGSLLFEARQRLMMSQSELALAAGVNRLTVARVEAGSVVPRKKTVERLLAAVGMVAEVLPDVDVTPVRAPTQDRLQGAVKAAPRGRREDSPHALYLRARREYERANELIRAAEELAATARATMEHLGADAHVSEEQRLHDLDPSGSISHYGSRFHAEIYVRSTYLR